jgi:hypothetical protein
MVKNVSSGGGLHNVTTSAIPKKSPPGSTTVSKVTMKILRGFACMLTNQLTTFRTAKSKLASSLSGRVSHPSQTDKVALKKKEKKRRLAIAELQKRTALASCLLRNIDPAHLDPLTRTNFKWE